VRRAKSFARTIAPPQSVFLAILLCSLGLIGCDNSCFVFVSNPGGGGGTIAGSINSCPLNQAKGSVRPRITTSFTAAAGNTHARIAHIYVNIRGIEANSNASADDASPDWQELAPQLIKQPAQIDLLAPSGDSPVQDAFDDVTVPANAYRQIRLRLTPNQPDGTNSVLQANSCGNVGFNCMVTSDSAIRPLALSSDGSEIYISSQQIAGGFVRVLPETTTTLRIEFNAQSSVFTWMNGLTQEPSDNTVQLVPIFSVESQTAEQTSAGANP
jgi:Domain of unknown function (DUF4382)